MWLREGIFPENGRVYGGRANFRFFLLSIGSREFSRANKMDFWQRMTVSSNISLTLSRNGKYKIIF